MRKIAILSIFAILVITSSAQASFFGDILGFFEAKNQPVRAQIQTPAVPNMDQLMNEMKHLNRPELINTLNKEFTSYGVKSVKVTVSDYQKVFYVVKDIGVVDSYPTYDTEITLTSSQIKRIIPIVSDGKIDILEWLRLQAIYKMG